MISEKTITYLIYIHASFGGLALLSGLIGLVSKKGGFYHRQAGKVFFYSLLFAVILSIVISLTPNNRSVFLFAIGIFSGYLIIGGFRAVGYKTLIAVPIWDRLLSVIMLLIGLLMVLGSIFYFRNIHVVLLVFGILGVALSIEDLFRMRNLATLKKNWLKMHFGKMIGGYIASVTAFLVVNDIFPGYLSWFLPTIIGSGYITFWNIKLKRLNR